MSYKQSLDEIGNTLTEAERECLKEITVLNMLVEAVNNAQVSLRRVNSLIDDIHEIDADKKYESVWASCNETTMRLGWLLSQARQASNVATLELMLEAQKRK